MNRQDENLQMQASKEVLIIIIQFSNEVIRIFAFNIICQFYMAIFSCKLIWLFDSKYIIIFAWFMDLITFILVMLDKNIGKSLSIFHFIEKVLSVSFKVRTFNYQITIVINFEVQQIQLYIIPAVQLVITIGLFLYLVLNNDQSKRKHIIIGQSYSVLYVVQMLLLTMKWNQFFSYSYYQTFIITWTALGINAFLIILLLVTMIENCFVKNIPQIDGSVILWLVFYLFGLTVVPFFLLKTICQFYEDDTIYVTIQIAAITVLVCLLLYTILISVFTYRIKNQLIILLQIEQRAAQSPKRPKQEEEVKQKWRKLKIPIMFIRVSASYYKMLGRQSTSDTNTRNMSAIPICSDVLRPDSLNFRQSPCMTMMKQMKSIPKDQDSNDFCLICFENEPDVVLHPCNHGGICNNCSENLMKTTKQCFLCRTEIKYALKLQNKGQVVEAIDFQKA